MYVDRLVERVDKLRQDIALFEAQIIAQTDETRAAKEALTEAHMEIEVYKYIYIVWIMVVNINIVKNGEYNVII